MPEPMVEKQEFKTEVSQLLDLVIHSLYSHKDIFLRELISNASDAIDKIRYRSLTQPDLPEADSDWKIKISLDPAHKTLTLSDNGIGMTHDELVSHLGTIAKSGTKEFLAGLQQQKDNVNLIGQFGVGFYSAFMVASQVEVVSKAPQSPAYRWVSDGQHGFEVSPAERAGRGTDVILHMKEENQNYLSEYEIRNLIKKYSDFVEFPIVMDVEREEKTQDNKSEKKIVTETLNSQKAIWAKPKQDVSQEEYYEFYRHLAHDFTDPLEVIHYHAEGTIEFKALIYIPSQVPFDLFIQDAQRGLSLYINRVFIMSDAKKLVPPYLRFLKGVVDTHDLPLNVSRELLQQDAQLDKISKNIVKKVLSTLKSLKEKDLEKYLKFYRAFGAVLKEGLHYDRENHEAIAELLLFETTRSESGQLRSLDQYLADMPAEQKSIYYHMAEDRPAALASPYLENFQAKGWEVLLLLEPIDEIVMPDLFEFKHKPLQPIGKGELETSPEEKEKSEAALKEAEAAYHDLTAYLQKKLDSEVQSVRFSKRLTTSPASIAPDESGLTRQMRELFKATGREVPAQKNILEINPSHPLVAALHKLLQENPDSEKLADYAALLYDQALLTAGFKLKDPAAFAKRLTQLLLTVEKS